ncbi:galactose mutarotase-like protein, partial [Fistulina hepatica ATCC 64428]
QRSWFVRDGEPGLHSFLRLAYCNSTDPVKGSLGETRTMFRPNGGPWTHIITNEEQYASLPSEEALADEVEVQDATWYLGLTPNDAYVIEESDYWTKYTFADNQNNKAHGLYGNASNGLALGAWWVVNQKDTFFDGPASIFTRSSIHYSTLPATNNPQGSSSPNITNGYDRTFGPQFLYFNHGDSASLQTLLADAQQYANPTWSADFYDEIATYVHGYATTSERGQFDAQIELPEGASKAVAVLSANNLHFQDSALDPTAYQYWETVSDNGSVAITRVKQGTYRLTVYATGIFGDYIQDDIVIEAGETANVDVTWTADSAGQELWRLGIPDKTSGEFRNGFERDFTHTNHPAKYRIYWGAWDFPTQFPDGVNFTIGSSNESVDWNYIHWSQYGTTYTRNTTALEYSKWQINFELYDAPNSSSIATFTMQLAGAKTTSGNTDEITGAYPTFNVCSYIANVSFLYALTCLQISTYINDQTDPLWFTVQANESSSCGERSAISCHLLSKKFQFPGTWLNQGANKFVLALPYNASVVRCVFSVLKLSQYVQYDALRLELSE